MHLPRAHFMRKEGGVPSGLNMRKKNWQMQHCTDQTEIELTIKTRRGTLLEFQDFINFEGMKM